MDSSRCYQSKTASKARRYTFHYSSFSFYVFLPRQIATCFSRALKYPVLSSQTTNKQTPIEQWYILVPLLPGKKPKEPSTLVNPPAKPLSAANMEQVGPISRWDFVSRAESGQVSGFVNTLYPSHSLYSTHFLTQARALFGWKVVHVGKN